MKLVIFGATGKVGQDIVEQALGQGHEVTAFTRAPEKLRLSNENLHVFEGDVLDITSVTRAVQGQDAVLCALGKPLMNKEQLRSKGTKNIVDAMEKANVKRLVCLSSLGVGDSYGILPFHYKYIIVPLFMRSLFADHTLQESYVRESSLDWIIVRPASFIKDGKKGAYRHGFSTGDKPAALKISTTDVADFMLKQVGEDKYLHSSPALSY